MDIKPGYYANAARSADDCPSRVSEFKMTYFIFFYTTYVRISYRKPLFEYFIWFFSKFLGGMQLSDPYWQAATAAIQWLSTSSSLKRMGRGTEHSTSTRCQGSECMAPSYTPQYVLMTCSLISTGETWRFRLHGYVVTTGVLISP